MDDLGQDNQTPISCRTCHNVHLAYDETDWSLTFADQVTETLFGYDSPDYTSYSIADYGTSNMCIQCHQARDRGNVPAADATADVTVSSHWGPHYGVQGNVLVAQAGVHIGTGYPTATGGHAAIGDACVTCHMSGGNHTLAVNYDDCVTCHSAGDAEDKTEALETEIHDLLFDLGKSLAGLGAMIPEVEGTDTVGYEPVGGYSGALISADEAKAVYNYMVVYQDHSYGAHNPTYIRALLNNSIASLP